MAKKKDKTEEQFAAVEKTLTRSEQWVENNQKILSIVVESIIEGLSERQKLKEESAKAVENNAESLDNSDKEKN